MIYNGLNREKPIKEIKVKNDKEVIEVYGGIEENNPIYYKKTTMEDVAPLSFKALGQPLNDYKIYGQTVQDGTPTPENPDEVAGVGEKDNVINFTNDTFTKHRVTWTKTENGLSISGTTTSPAGAGTCFLYGDMGSAANYVDYAPIIQSHSIILDAGTYKFSYNSIGTGDSCGIDVIIGNAGETIRTGALQIQNNVSFTLTESKLCMPVGFMFGTVDRVFMDISLSRGYKIPITCGGVTTNIYLDSPLYEGDSISFSAAQTIIPTTVGQNTLSIGTTVQPSKVLIEGNIKT